MSAPTPLFQFSAPIRGNGSSVTVRLPDGELADVRPLGPDEHQPLTAVFDAMSTQSRFSRYLTGLTQLPPGMRRTLTAVDGHDHVAWLASVEGQPAGIGRYVRTAPRTAEVAFEVVDAHQRRGLGTVLVDVLSTVAAVSGIRRVEATVLPSNTPSLLLLERIGITFRLSAGELEGDGELRLLDPPRVDRPAVARLALSPALTPALAPALTPALAPGLVGTAGTAGPIGPWSLSSAAGQ